MPTISIFIRKDDLDKFKALPNKSEFIHKALLNYRFDAMAERALPAIKVMNKKPIAERAEFLAEAYAAGHKAYEKAKLIKTPDDIPNLSRDDPGWSGPIYRNKKKGKL